ncbi:MAG: S9 family peptidase, partial [Bacteroidales bacterium]|nr:S9 family peptidase [Bacteroidales bacterium]
YKAEFGKEPVQLTSGEFEVKQIAAIDFPKKTIYYLSNESEVLNQDLYSINFDGKKKRMLTDGTGWNTPTFNSNAHYYCNMYSNSNTPPIYTLHNNIGKKLRTIEDNAKFKERISEYGFAKKEHFSFTTDEGISLNGWMIKPADFSQNSGKKYPVLMYVYGGPGSQEVTNSYFRGNDHAWYQMLAQKGYIVVCVDGRGTASRGDAFKKVIYKQMGKYEAIDQIATANYLKTLPYVDGDRIGIWGWSFGGYLSSLAMFKGKGVFKMAMSVAPVTNWRYYDNIYTERFLQKPQDNPEGYDDNAPCFSAKDLQGAYLLVHGTADDNVHFQNAMDLVTQLNKAGKQYEQFFYPNKNHFIYGGNTRYQLYTKLTDFLLKNL